jgi:hypothetical protein
MALGAKASALCRRRRAVIMVHNNNILLVSRLKKIR